MRSPFFKTITPSSHFHAQLEILGRTLPLARDGDPEGIHDARIATRRLREVLPLLSDDPRWRRIDDLFARFKTLGKFLGAVRDVDARISLLASCEARIPPAAPALVALRHEQERARLLAVRKLIKQLERLNATAFVRSLNGGERRLLPWRQPQAGSASWQRDLDHTVTARAQEAVAAIEHATQVYFPNRAHRARIAIKKLRYAAELLDQTRRPEVAAGIRELKKTQDILGDLHDRQVLVEYVAGWESDPPVAPHEQVTLVRQLLEAEATSLHGRYLQHRDRVLELARTTFQKPRASFGSAPALLTAGALAVSSAAYVAHRIHANAGER